MMLVTGLTGPIFLALSLFPTSNKPVVTWITSFLSMGLCKICFSLISGLSAVAMVYAGYVDMLVAAVVLGLLAPVLSFSIATGSGLGALTTISYSAQTFGANIGISTYTPSSHPKPNTQAVEDE
jgi:ABC-type transport system involved in cytochrome c biogenesis permease component